MPAQWNTTQQATKVSRGYSALDESQKFCADWSQFIHRLICILYCGLKPGPFMSWTSTLPLLLLVLTTKLISYSRSPWLPSRRTGRRTLGAGGRVCVLFSESHRCWRLMDPVKLDTALGKPGGNSLPPPLPLRVCDATLGTVWDAWGHWTGPAHVLGWWEDKAR